MKRCKTMLLLGMYFLLLSGCGYSESETVSEQTGDKEEGAAVLVDSEDVHLVYEIVSESGVTFQVDADMTGGEKLSQCRYYNVKQLEFDETYLKTYVYPVFDTETAAYVKPYDICTKAELDSRKMELEGQLFYLQRMEAESVEDTLNKQKEAGDTQNSSVWMPDETENNEFYKLALQTDLETLKGYYKDLDTQNALEYNRREQALYTCEQGGCTNTKSRLDGRIEGVPYVYMADEVVNDENHGGAVFWTSQFVRYDKLETEITVRACLDNEAVDGLDVNTAQQQADDFLAKLGYGDFMCYESGIGMVYEDERMQEKYYCFSYSRNIDEIGVASTPVALGFRFSLRNTFPVPTESIVVAVDANGVAKVRIQDRIYERTDEGTKVEAHLSVEQVEAIAQKFMRTYEENTGFGMLQIQQVRLEYAYVSYDGVEVHIIPVWSYYGMRDGTRTSFLFGVSAIDGEIVYGDYMQMVMSTYQI